MSSSLSSYRKVFIFYFAVQVAADINETDVPRVQLPQGIIEGRYHVSYRNKTFSAFEGIPYARPPVGELRFREPAPPLSWNGTLVAQNQYECLQFLPIFIVGVRGTEDCLYLYVYVPRRNIDQNEMLDVVVHIHGGGFMIGSPKVMSGPEFLMDRDIVYVTMNYRLGVLGFLSTEDDTVPGNNGLKDQVMAMEWIKENIKYFGGNPNSVTLTGLSAGAACVHFHYFSPKSKGLFHRGLSQSGTALQRWSIFKYPLKQAQSVARNLTCTTSTTKQMIDCLRKVDSKTLVNGIRHLNVLWDVAPFIQFAPVIEPPSKVAYLSENPYTLLSEGLVYDVPWITSNTDHEGLLYIQFAVAKKKVPEIEEKWDDIISNALGILDNADLSDFHKVSQDIRKFYYKNKSISESMNESIQLFSDTAFLMDAERALRMQAEVNKSNVYYYKFSYLLNMSGFLKDLPKGVNHGDDARLMYRTLLTPHKLSESDEKMMDGLVDFLVSYAKTSIPSIGAQRWLPIEPGAEKLNVMVIRNPDDIHMANVEELTNATQFWKSLQIRDFLVDSAGLTLTSCSIVLVCFVVNIILI